MADGAFCSCNVGTAEAGECLLCHESCASCIQSRDSNKCTSCTATDATLSNTSGGNCYCGIGFKWQSPATSACEACYSGCSYCADSTQAACMEFQDLAVFAVNLASSYSLPLNDQSDGFICYRQPAPNLTICDPVSLVVKGTVVSDGTGLHLDDGQCYELLRAQWLSVSYWFGKIFPNFSSTIPTRATETEKYELKTVLWLWLLHYGAHTMTSQPSWKKLVDVFKSPSLDWAGLLGWAGATPGYLAGGVTHEFPNGLVLSASELKLFNHFSTVCSASNCNRPTECAQVPLPCVA